MVYGNEKCNHKEEKAKLIKPKDEQGLTMLPPICTAFIKEGFYLQNSMPSSWYPLEKSILPSSTGETEDHIG